MDKSKQFIGKKVKIYIDRQLGSKHPKHSFFYPVNYGYIKEVISPDGEYLDAYLLGIFEPVNEYEGKVIAVIHRTNDEDDKLIVAPEGIEYTDEQIRALTEFQERFFQSIIIRDIQYSRGVELVTGAIIEREDGKILITQSPKWNNKWAIPGGHIEPGEGILEAAVREGMEETGLKLQGIDVLGWGELIGDPDFHRPAHFIYFDTYCKVISGDITLDSRELSQYTWATPKEALEMDLISSDFGSIQRYIEYLSKQ